MMQSYHRSTPVWHALSRDHTVLPAIHAFIHEWNEPAFLSIFPAKAGTHLLSPEGWKAELAVSKQSAEDCYMSDITVVTCHWAGGFTQQGAHNCCQWTAVSSAE